MMLLCLHLEYDHRKEESSSNRSTLHHLKDRGRDKVKRDTLKGQSCDIIKDIFKEQYLLEFQDFAFTFSQPLSFCVLFRIPLFKYNEQRIGQRCGEIDNKTLNAGSDTCM